MTTRAHIDTTLRVTSVRSRGSFGGVIFAGKDGAGRSYVVKAQFKLMPDPSLVETAQVWRVVGTMADVSYVHAGVERTEAQIEPTSLSLERPSGKNVVSWIAHSSDCRGIGEVRARRLYERFGLELIDLVEKGDAERLGEVLEPDLAESLISAFAKHGIAQTLVWLEQMGLPIDIASSVARYWGKEARSKVSSNPYVLISFCADWRQVDTLAASRFGVKPDDSRRLVAAAEDVLNRAMSAGNTALKRSEAKSRLQDLLGSPKLAQQSIVEAIADGRVVEDGELLQPAGLAYIESYVADSLGARLAGKCEGQEELFQTELPPESAVQKHLNGYESVQGIALTAEQRQAVVTSATNRVSLILGGAGTGKTTVLRALCHVLEQITPRTQIHQFALAGRAAQRMTQATGRPATTIAAFLQKFEVASGSTVLIDEVSMVDAILMYRVLRELPSDVRLVFIGDPAQLPPIGPGLVLHALQGVDSIPQTTLTTVKRQSATSSIPLIARSVRERIAPRWDRYAGRGFGVSALACDAGRLDEAAADLYAELGGDGSNYSVQILGTTKNGAGGVHNLNAIIHTRFASKQTPVQSISSEYGLISERTEENLTLFAGDLVMFGANDYTLGLRNGSLGRVLRVVAPQNPTSVVCVAEFEGAEYELTSQHLRHVTHAYAITTHKSQGSQFERVIVPLRNNKLLDNAILYTAITRAVEQVVLIGDLVAAERAIRSVSHAARRVTRLGTLVAKTVRQAITPRPSPPAVRLLECL